MFLTRMICFGVIPVVGKRLPLSQLCWLMAVPSVVMDLHILFLLLVRWLVFRPKEETTIGWAGNCGGGIRESAILVACVRRRLYFQKWCLPSLEAGGGWRKRGHGTGQAEDHKGNRSAEDFLQSKARTSDPASQLASS